MRQWGNVGRYVTSFGVLIKDPHPYTHTHIFSFFSFFFLFFFFTTQRDFPTKMVSHSLLVAFLFFLACCRCIVAVSTPATESGGAWIGGSRTPPGQHAGRMKAISWLQSQIHSTLSRPLLRGENLSSNEGGLLVAIGPVARDLLLFTHIAIPCTDCERQPTSEEHPPQICTPLLSFTAANTHHRYAQPC